ncbi:MAG: hypothetical protein Q8R07_01350, partial [Candidatus Uhrbacteria bacterium]|nr:hypothetical protein [Candidatus Uhrbacteria bacterium]
MIDQAQSSPLKAQSSSKEPEIVVIPDKFYGTALKLKADSLQLTTAPAPPKPAPQPKPIPTPSAIA